MGPTASGKTRLAFELCDHLNAEIISVDSALVYRGLNIGSAKPTAQELQRYPHRLVDIRDPANPYTAADFRRDALAAMADITAQGKVPLLVGGTMLYFKALLDGLVELPPIEPTIRASIERQAKTSGWPALHAELTQCDPETAANLHPNHSQRICRALEVYRSTGRPLSHWRRQQAEQALPYRLLQLAVAPAERTLLHQRIEQRLTTMFASGFVDEVRQLYQRGDLDRNLPAIRAVGYRQVWEYLSGEISESDMQAKALAATRQLAKRQFTWLRKWPSLHWLLWKDAEESLLPALFEKLSDVDFPVDGLY